MKIRLSRHHATILLAVGTLFLPAVVLAASFAVDLPMSVVVPALVASTVGAVWAIIRVQ